MVLVFIPRKTTKPPLTKERVLLQTKEINAIGHGFYGPGTPCGTGLHVSIINKTRIVEDLIRREKKG